MKPNTYKLHASLIRLAKGMISAWENWVKEQQTVELNPDPVKHFTQQK